MLASHSKTRLWHQHLRLLQNPCFCQLCGSSRPMNDIRSAAMALFICAAVDRLILAFLTRACPLPSHPWRQTYPHALLRQSTALQPKSGHHLPCLCCPLSAPYLNRRKQVPGSHRLTKHAYQGLSTPTGVVSLQKCHDGAASFHHTLPSERHLARQAILSLLRQLHHHTSTWLR